MKKKFSALLPALICFSAISAAAYADGPVARTIDDLLRDGEDMIDGAGDAAGDVIDGAGDAAGDVIDGVTDGADELLGGDTHDAGADPDDDDTPAAYGETTSETESSDASDDVSESSVTSTTSETASEATSASESTVSGLAAAGAAGAANPGTGVPFGFTAAAAVIAAVSIAATTARKPR